jgi:hypothetical protein
MHEGRRHASDSVRVDEVRSPDGHACPFVRGLLQGDVEIQTAPEVDDSEGQQQEDRRDDRELDQTLRLLASKPWTDLLPQGLPWIVKCSL